MRRCCRNLTSMGPTWNLIGRYETSQSARNFSNDLSFSGFLATWMFTNFFLNFSRPTRQITRRRRLWSKFWLNLVYAGCWWIRHVDIGSFWYRWWSDSNFSSEGNLRPQRSGVELVTPYLRGRKQCDLIIVSDLRMERSLDLSSFRYALLICCGLSKVTSWICTWTPTTHRSSASAYRRHLRSCRSGCRGASMRLRRGCAGIVCSSLPQRLQSVGAPLAVSSQDLQRSQLGLQHIQFYPYRFHPLSWKLSWRWLSMKSHVNKIVSSCFAVHLHAASVGLSHGMSFQAGSISLVLNHHEYGNAKLAGISARLRKRLQSVFTPRHGWSSRRQDSTVLLRSCVMICTDCASDSGLSLNCSVGCMLSAVFGSTYVTCQLRHVADVECSRCLRSASAAWTWNA